MTKTDNAKGIWKEEILFLMGECESLHGTVASDMGQDEM